jgi:hypothetical protein
MKGTSSIRTWTRLEEASQPLTTKTGRIPAGWNNHTGPAGSSVILFAPDPSDTTRNPRWDGVPQR